MPEKATPDKERPDVYDQGRRQSQHTERTRKRKAEEAFTRKEFNKKAIADTMTMCERLQKLFGKPARCHVYLLPATDPFCKSQRRTGLQHPATEIYAGDCVCCAQEIIKQPGAKVWILNMACATRPGGGAKSGANAQEEHLCRCSNLLPQLEAAGTKHFPLHKSRANGIDFKVLAHPQVVFFKRASDYTVLPPKDWFRTGVLTAAAENTSKTHHSVGPNAARFIDYLLDVVNHQDCSHVILSAWGCGAFRQSPLEVATYFKQSLARFDERSFPKVIFAITDDHNNRPPGNLSTFANVFTNSARAT